jgi:hypothetical protein
MRGPLAASASNRQKYHRKRGFDANIPRDAVLVREVRTNGQVYRVAEIWDGLPFYDPAGELRIEVALDPGADQAHVTITRNGRPRDGFAYDSCNPPAGGAKGVAVSSWGANRLDVFAWRSSDNGLSHMWYDNDNYSQWEDLSGTFVAPPRAVSGPSRIDLVGLGTDLRIWHKYYNGSCGPKSCWYPQDAQGNPGWEPISNQRFSSAPTIASWGPSRLDVFARGTDNQLYHAWAQNSGFSSFEALGLYFQGDPTAVSWGTGRIDMFGLDASNQLVHAYYDHDWGPRTNGVLHWEGVGGYLTTSPGASSWGPNRLDIFARGGDNGQWHTYWDNGWGGWEGLGGHLTSAPQATSWGLYSIHDFAVQADGTLLHTRYPH